MKLTPLLDYWQKPEDAGDPVAVFATTFTLDSAFFEQSCLAQFLAVASVDEGTGSADDLVARLELEESLRAPAVTVLADRSASGERSTLRWDVLQCHVPNNGLLHSKVAILIWERATRVIVGSANLTPAGYRRQIELALAADLGPQCILPPAVMLQLAEELESYLDLVPGLSADVPARLQAMRTLGLFRERVANQSPVTTDVKVAFAPTNAELSPFDTFEPAWVGARPLWATQLSPFWDTDDPLALRRVADLLSGRPKDDRWHEIAVVHGPGGDVTCPPGHFDFVDAVHELDLNDGEIRRLHAKCLLLSSQDWTAALVGSSNHTRSGLGLGRVNERRHREINLWLGAPSTSKAGKALAGLVPVGEVVEKADATFAVEIDEDEIEESVPILPPCFELCRLVKNDGGWMLTFSFNAIELPDGWLIKLPSGQTILDDVMWRSEGAVSPVSIAVPGDELPMFVTVEWDGRSISWATLADDRHSLPPGAGLVDLNSVHLLDALAAGKSISQAVREGLVKSGAEMSNNVDGAVIDPLKRFDDRGSLLRRGRALAQSLAAMQRRLQPPTQTLDALVARLSSPLGPIFVGTKVADDVESGTLSAADGLFTLAEIALTVGRVDWSAAIQFERQDVGISAVRDALDALQLLTVHMGSHPDDLAEYAERALKEARRCLTS